MKENKKINIQVKGWCTCKCVFCSKGINPPETKDNYDAIVDSLREIDPSGFSEVVISGGEPLNYPRFEELVQFLKGKGFKNITVQTTGERLSDMEFLKKICAAGASKFEVPIYGPNEKIHDSITRTEGSFKRAVDAVRNIKSQGIDYELHSVIIKQNLPYVREINEFCKKEFGKNTEFWVLEPDSEKAEEYYACAPRLSELPLELVKENLELPCVTGRRPEKRNNSFRTSKCSDIRAKSKVKPEKCSICEYFSSCKGYYNQYFEIYGEDEITPVVKNPVANAGCIFEKKKWVSVTGLCNNNCRFCLDAERPDKFHKEADRVKNEIKEGRNSGCTKLILSGGDPTIHPNIEDFVRYGREVGYTKIQLITNGRMFASKEFTDRVIDAGLDEVTFSIHGYNSGMHDSLTNVPGSFRQIMKGVKNVFASSKKMIVNTDTCITKSNYMELPKIIKFIVEKAGINEVNLMSMVPQGNAWKQKDEIMYDYEDAAPYVHKVIDYCIKNNVVLWLSRFPAEYLEGYEAFIEDPYKMVDDVRGCSKDVFEGKETPPCIGERCKYCGIRAICPAIQKINRDFISGSAEDDEKDNFKRVVITRENLKSLAELIERKDKVLFEFPEPGYSLEEYRKKAPLMKDAAQALDKVSKKVKVWKTKNIPQCIFKSKNDKSQNFGLKNEYVQNRRLDYVKIAEDLACRAKTKRVSCKNCSFNEQCEGIFINYARTAGFSEFNPVKKHIEINLGKKCNSSCSFCMIPAESKYREFAGIDKVKKELGEMRGEGYNSAGFAGGEPTIYKGILDVIKYAKEIGYAWVEIVTNGTGLSDKDFLAALIDAGLNRIVVSAHTHREEKAEELYGSVKIHRMKMKGIENLAEAKRRGLKFETALNFIISKHNMGSLAESVRFFSKMGFNDFRFNSINPYGNALKNFDDVVPKFSSTKKILKEVAGTGRELGARISFGDVPLCMIPEEYRAENDEYIEDVSSFSDSAEGENIKWKENRKNELKKYAESCSECGIKKICEGVWEKYIEKYGENEFENK